MAQIETAIVLCAGSGSRMMPFTNFYPKSFLPIKDNLALELVLLEAVKSGVKKVVFVHNQNDKFLRKFAKWFNQTYSTNIKFVYCEQKDRTGSGGAVLLCEKYVDKPFFLMFADDITKSSCPVLLQLERVFLNTGKSVVGVRKVEKEMARHYGILKPLSFRRGILGFCGIVEKPMKPFEENYANFGRYVLTPEIFEILKSVNKEENGEVYLTKALETLAKQNKVVGFRFKGKCFDVGTMKNYIKAFKEY